MRILQIVTSYHSGGIQKHVLQLGESLNNKGHQVFFAGEPGQLLDKYPGINYQPIDVCKVANLENLGGKGRNLIQRIFSTVSCALTLRRYLKDNRIELVHAHDTAPVIIARMACVGLGIPVLLTYHGSNPERVKAFGWVGRLTSKLVITPSLLCAKDLNRQSGLPEKKLKVIELGIEPPPAINKSLIEQQRASSLGDDPDGYVVVMVARLAYQKGIDYLIEVVKQVLEKRKDIHFVVLGDGPYESQVEQWAKEAAVDSHLKFEGYSANPYQYLFGADIFLLTSRWEALPIAIAEALQVGLPVVATDTGGVKELVSPDMGRILAVGDVNGLAQSILEICGDDELRKSMSDKAYQVSQEERFSIPHVHNRFERLYQNILGIVD
jgi:glycosyltransferase involved in cell wall biosynthesis